MTKPAAGKLFHQCVYILCQRDKPLMEAAASIRKAFNYNDDLSDYMPHISLLYSDMDQDTRCVFFSIH